MAILKEELEQLKDSVASSKEIERGLKEELAASKGELAKLKGEVNGCRSEVTITFELKGIEALIAAGSGQVKYSKDFTCGGELEIV